MKLSLIIPNYNYCKYLSKCVDSVLEQSRLPDEVIIIDGGSTDGSIDLIKKYAKEYDFIHPIFQKEKKGISYDRNYAIMKANGDYITNLDSDDFYFGKNKIKNELELIKQHPNKNIIPYSDIVLVDQNDKEFYRIYSNENINISLSFEKIISRKAPIPQDFIFSKDQYLKAGGYDTNINLYEDWDLTARLASFCKFKYTCCDGVAYRCHPEGLSSTNVFNLLEGVIYVFKKNVGLMSKKERYILFSWLIIDYIRNTIFSRIITYIKGI